MDTSSALLSVQEFDGRKSRLCEVLLQLASAQELLGNESAAFAALEEALHIGSTEGHGRPLIDEAKAIRDLISRWLVRRADLGNPAATFASQLISFHSCNGNQDAPQTASTAISTRERQILGLLNQGMSNAKIAKRCCISEGTVKWYLHNLYEKFGVRNRTSLLYAVRKKGLALH